MIETRKSLLIQRCRTEPVIQILKKLCAERKVSVSLGGGAVRDFLLGQDEVNDFDFYLEASSEVAQEIKSEVGRQATAAGHKLKSQAYDFKECRSAVQYLSQADLTINAISLELHTELFSDPTGGFKDLASKTVRHISRTSFVASPRAFPRVFRFSAQLGFQIEENTYQTVCEYRSMIGLANGITRSRIFSDILKFLSENIGKSWDLFCSSRIIENILPFLVPTLHVPSTKPGITMFEWNAETVRQSDAVLRRLPVQVQSWLTNETEEEILVEKDRLSTTATYLAILRLTLLCQRFAKSYVHLDPDISHQFHTLAYQQTATALLASASKGLVGVNPHQAGMLSSIMHLSERSDALLDGVLNSKTFPSSLIEGLPREEQKCLSFLLLVNLQTRLHFSHSAAWETSIMQQIISDFPD